MAEKNLVVVTRKEKRNNMKKYLIVLLAIFLIGCAMEPQEVFKVGTQKKYNVNLLFEQDGIKVYRFWDMGKAHYFTTTGETMSAEYNNKSFEDENIKIEAKPTDQ